MSTYIGLHRQFRTKFSKIALITVIALLSVTGYSHKLVLQRIRCQASMLLTPTVSEAVDSLGVKGVGVLVCIVVLAFWHCGPSLTYLANVIAISVSSSNIFLFLPFM